MDKTIIEIPSHILDGLQLTPKQLKRELAAYLYHEYNLPLEKAAEVAGLTEGVDIYTRQVLNMEEGKEFGNFFHFLGGKYGIRSQEWSADVDDELQQLLLIYEKIPATKQMVKRLNSISETVETICRELRLSLTNLSFIAEAFRNDILSLEQLKMYLQSGSINDQYQRRIICTLEDIVKIESGNLSLQFGEVNLKETIEKTIEAVSNTETYTDTKFETSIPNNLPKIWADEYRILNVLNSFILNTRGEMLRFNIVLTYDKEWVTILISDNGDGVPAEFTENWTRFGNIPSVNASGIGRLERAVGEYLIKAHNGKIDIEYNDAIGTRVIIKLPILI